MSTLYRKYRPQNFKEVFGQNHIKISLENQIQQEKTAHAYLFCGPRGIGKTTLARIFSKSINCIGKKKNESDPCNKCEICTDINSARALDIVEIDAASHTGVDNVRENIIAFARIAPSRCKYKVFIIDEVHMLSISAFNALLKVLEEPPARVAFILCTTEIHKVPATIISRCQRFNFKRISIDNVVKRLKYITEQEGVKIDENVLESIARRSEGHMRDAESLLGQVVAIGGKNITKEEADLVIPKSNFNEIVNLIEFFSQKNCPKAIGLVKQLIDDGVDLKVFVIDLVEILRKLMLSKISNSLLDSLDFDLGEDLQNKINKACVNIDTETISNWIEELIEVNTKMKNSFIVQLPLELAITRICVLKTNQSFSAQVVPTATENPIKEDNATKFSSPVNFSSKWNEVLLKIKKHNHSLSFILKVCQPRELSNNKICLAFKYKFHKDRVEEAQVKGIIEKVLEEVYGKPFSIEAIIDETISLDSEVNNEVEAKTKTEDIEETQDKTNNKKMLNNILDTFGGKVIQ